ncbi:MAG TPA: hypothetical protein VHY83_11885 [Solirubrobacteraceae bacterium]|jgi:hypothetical protein|nr:hypothetical protein [Solirubrobacteraceae bacterium]
MISVAASPAGECVSDAPAAESCDHVSARRNGTTPTAGRPAEQLPALTLSTAPVRSLGRYTLDGGGPREILSVARADGSTLVLDALAGSLADARLVGDLACDEPSQNAQLLCAMYLADESRGRCRPLTEPDLNACGPVHPAHPAPGDLSLENALLDRRGRAFVLREVTSPGFPPELRWTRSPACRADDAFDTVALRNVVGALEDYEPARTLTALALDADHAPEAISTRRLRLESERLARSPIVLNRRLREAVETRLASGQTMSEIAIRCGRTKRNPHGGYTGETSWLARRIGQMAEAGRGAPTLWVHSDTLALIAREGLGIDPHEVEL